ncbi:CBN-UNC-49 protein [Caenorhabditis brenneri]|uniref:CBN-UNC-49 protein n=1 Tax=Caenorhabditis brenneri TaxID=135651 RepID=G0MKV1_CAEBE|nr:CBN-UNC-49 protein [Caenorhabditis brenneri]
MTRSSFTFVIVLLSAQLCLHVVLCQDEDSHINTSLLSSVLDRLTNRTTYDKRLRPRYGEKPVDVGITIHVSSISAVSEVDMDFTLDFYMRQTWQDPRLAFGSLDLGLSKEIDSLTVGVDYLDKLWKPDTFFPNEKKSFFHLATTHNSFLRIDSDGTVYTSQRLTVTATCPMDLKLFPMDSQHCKLEIESFTNQKHPKRMKNDGYSILDIVYVSHEKKSVSTESYELPQFVLQSIKVVNQTQKLSSGEYSRLCWYFLFKRNIGFYIIQIYLPSVLIVVISWVSFWLSRDATPARVALGVTTVLTMTTLMTMTNSAMPKVSYVKSIDIFLGVCFMMVFCSLLEYAAVGYISKRMKLVRARKESRMLTPLPQMEPPPKRTLSVPSYFNNQTYRPFYSSTDRTSNLYIPESQRTIIFANEDAVPNEMTPMLGRSNSQASVFLYQRKYVRLALEVILVRNMGFYTMNIVIPSILIVTISWVSFWLNREASPARVGLGVTTVLTMTTLITTTNNSMPKVSYVKGLDVFLNFCFVMVFASLLEYAIVSYMNKRLVLRREKRRKAAEQQQRNEMPMFNASPKAANNNADLYFAGHNSSMNPLMEIPENCDCRTIPMMQHPRLVTDGAHTLWPAPFARPKKMHIQRPKSSTIGTYSRLRVSFIFDRDSGFYFLQIFFPASLVVVLSWISFWINRDSAPSRTLIGTMTVLTETHLMTGTNRRLPPVAYVKAVDVFLGFCYLLVILALIEYACVAYSKKKNEDRRRREKKMEHKPAPPTPDILHDVRLAECTCNAAPTSIIAVIKQPNRFCVSHSHIDIVSRAAFPIVFIVFNIVFWLILLYKSKRLPYISEHEGDRCDAPDLH